MCRVPVQLRELVKQRLAEAAEEIFALVEKTICDYEEHLIAKYEQQRQQGALCIPVYQELTPEVPDLAVVQTVGGADGEISVEPPQLEQIQIVQAQGPVKEEQLLMTIAQTLIKEEPHPSSDPAPSCDNPVLEPDPSCADPALGSAFTLVKEEPAQASDPEFSDPALDSAFSLGGQESKALSLLFIKQEPTEQRISLPLPQDQPNTTPQTQVPEPDQHSNPSPDPILDQNLHQEPHHKIVEQNVDQEDPNLNQNQDQDLNQDLNQDFDHDDNEDWEFEGLSPSRQSPNETENSSEEEETFPPDNPPKLLRTTPAPSLSQGAALGPKTTQTDEEATENSSDDSEDTSVNAKKNYLVISAEKPLCDRAVRTMELRIVNNSVVKTPNISVRTDDSTKTDSVEKKRKRKRRVKRKSAKASAPQVCSVCKRTFDSLTKLTAHAKAHAESAPCPVCGKLFKQRGFLEKHMRAHKSTKSQENTDKSGTSGLLSQESTKNTHTKLLRAHTRPQNPESTEKTSAKSTRGQEVTGKTSGKHMMAHLNTQSHENAERKITKYFIPQPSTGRHETTERTSAGFVRAQPSTQSQATTNNTSTKRKADSDHTEMPTKRMTTLGDTDSDSGTDRTEDSSDDN